MLDFIKENCNLIAESPNKQTAIWQMRRGANDYFIITEDGSGDFLCVMFNDRDFEKGDFEKIGKDIVELVKDGETTAADWASLSLITEES